MVTIPTIAEIKNQILSDIETNIGQDIPLLPKAVFRVLATAIAGVLHLLYRFGAWVYRQIFTLTMDDEALALRGAEYGLSRTAATPFKGTATATGDNDTVIPAGTIFTADGYVYTVDEAEIISGGTATVDITSTETGDDVNLSVSDTLEITTPISGLDSTLTVASVTQTAEDQETLENYRDRIIFRQQNQPQGGAVADYVLWAREVSGIAEAYAFRPTSGSPNVDIYCLLDVDDPANRLPDATKRTEVENYVSDTIRRPLNAVVSVEEFDELTFDVDIADLSPSNATLQNLIEDNIEAYMYGRRPEQYDDEVNPKNIISEAAIAKICIDSGADVATVDLKNAGGSSITSYTLEDDELAVLGTLTWT